MTETDETDHINDLDLQVFALCLRQEGAVEYFHKHLQPEDIGKPRGFDGLCELYRNLQEYYKSTGDNIVDPQGFKTWAESKPQLMHAVGGKEGLDTLFKPVLETDLSTPKAVASMLRQRSQNERRRQLVDHLQELVQDDNNSSDVDRVVNQIRAINSDPTGSILETAYTGHDIAQRVNKLYEIPNFLQTPYPKLNAALSFNEDGGLAKGGVYAIVAASGAGKSTLARAFTLNWIQNQRNVVFVNYEEAQDHWERLMFTHITQYNAYTINKESQDIQDKAAKEYMDTMEAFGDHLIVQHNPDTIFFEDLEQWLIDLADQRNEVGQPLDAVIIDTLQSLFMRSGGGPQRWSQFEQMMVRLENLAKELDVAIIITSQENNNRIKEKRDVAEQSDIGGSVTIVQKSTAVMDLIKKDVMDDPDTDGSMIEVQIPKNRITGDSYALEPPILKFNENTKSFDAVDIQDLQTEIDVGELMGSISDFFS